MPDESESKDPGMASELVAELEVEVNSTPAPVSHFLYVTCQLGAEPAVKSELAERWPAFRFAYSRPGFLTFKLPTGHGLTEDFDLHSTFARSHGFSLGKARVQPASGTDENSDIDHPALVAESLAVVRDQPFDRIHVWERDAAVPGHRGYEPGPTPATAAVAQALAAALAARSGNEASAESLLHSAQPGQRVLDCVLVEPHEWWLGVHRVASVASRWPGGIAPLSTPDDMVSRAYLKLQEGVLWSRLPIQPGDHCAEIGSAPGGASQYLLERGLNVMGIDPAEMDERVLANPNFRHVRKRGAAVRKREFRDTQWLMADINVAPSYTLDTVEPIVTHAEVHILGMILTLKLLVWKLADELPAYLDRIRSWGFADVRARQLSHNRQEICVAALRTKDLRRHHGRGRAASQKA